MRGNDNLADPTLDALLDQVYGAAEDDPTAALEMLVDAEQTWPDNIDLLFARGELEWTLHGPEAAEPHYRRAIELDPEFADARYALGEVLGLLGEEQAMIAENLEVRRLDIQSDAGQGLGTREDQRFIAQVAEDVLAEIPEQFSDRLRNVPVVLEARPGEALVREGFDPRALGLFEGQGDLGVHSNAPQHAPTRIVLFYANLLASFPDEEALREEIEVTILHEIGHFFGLDEEDMERLGLE